MRSIYSSFTLFFVDSYPLPCCVSGVKWLVLKEKDRMFLGISELNLLVDTIEISIVHVSNR